MTTPLDFSQGEKTPLFSHTGEVPGLGPISVQANGDGVAMPKEDQDKRLGVWSTVFFIVTGVMLTLPLPQTFKQAGLVSGILIMLAIAACVSYQAVALGRCWLIITEKYPEKYGHDKLIRRPYPSIALEATGSRVLYYISVIGIDITNYGVGLVDLLISAQSLQCTLFPHAPLTIIHWLLIVTGLMWPCVLLGAPMESWAVGWAGGFGCLFASFLLIVALMTASAGGGMSSDHIVKAGAMVMANATTVMPSVTTPIAHNSTSPAACAVTMDYSDTITFESFGLGFSTLLFAFAGLSLFPTFQHDMKEPKKWPKAALTAYALICSFSIVTAVLGYMTYRGGTLDNILDNIHYPNSAKILAKITSAIFVLVYMANGVVAFIPVTADFEEWFNLGKKFRWPHLLIRTVILWTAMLIAAVKPQFSNFIPLVGSTAIALNNFVFPAWFHLKLNGNNIGLHEKVFNWEILIVGAVGIIAGTYASVLGII